MPSNVIKLVPFVWFPHGHRHTFVGSTTQTNNIFYEVKIEYRWASNKLFHNTFCKHMKKVKGGKRVIETDQFTINHYLPRLNMVLLY